MLSRVFLLQQLPANTSVGSITQRKGHDVLIKALFELTKIDWRLTIIGPQHFDRHLFETLKTLAHDLKISNRITFLDALNEDELEAQYQSADIFALASRYEGYGMAYAEAIVRGIPVIGTTAGAIPDTVPAACGILAKPDHVESFKDALRKIMTDETVRGSLGKNAIASEPSFPTWRGSAEKFAMHLKELL